MKWFPAMRMDEMHSLPPPLTMNSGEITFILLIILIFVIVITRSIRSVDLKEM